MWSGGFPAPLWKYGAWFAVVVFIGEILKNAFLGEPVDYRWGIELGVMVGLVMMLLIALVRKRSRSN